MDARYPIGKYQPPAEVNASLRARAIGEIAVTPAKFRAAVAGLNDAQLDTPYREGGWTVRQVIHHVPDSHMNAYVRWKLALTETEPTIKPYDEARWAELADSKTTPIEASLALLENLHERWVRLLRSVEEADFARTFRHPEQGVRTLDWMLFLYEWHGKHHIAHVTELRKQKNWQHH
ncbi:MAG TPA: bacillithiol transferase BstA [Terriglobales bacterium]|nr:bacillithiol transferase BstA [Terriglobales bacterium]